MRATKMTSYGMNGCVYFWLVLMEDFSTTKCLWGLPSLLSKESLAGNWLPDRIADNLFQNNVII